MEHLLLSVVSNEHCMIKRRSTSFDVGQDVMGELRKSPDRANKVATRQTRVHVQKFRLISQHLGQRNRGAFAGSDLL
jgi:hypothetical protein